jgi:integrase/recombinase XerD
VLAIYKRHAAPCPQKSRQYRRCNCPCWVEGTVEGKYYRKSLKTRNWERATKLAREIEEGKKPRIAITEATYAFVRDAEARGLRPTSVYKYRLLFKQLKAFSEKEGLQLLSECDVETLRRFRESWINKNYSARKKLEALRAFFRFAHESSCTDSNPALLIKPTKVDDPPTLPYTQAEFRSVVEACGKYPRPEHPNKQSGARLKALVLLLRYSGLRITDAVTLSNHQIADGS